MLLSTIKVFYLISNIIKYIQCQCLQKDYPNTFEMLMLWSRISVMTASLADIKLKWKWMKIFKVRKILIKSYVNLNRVKYVPIIHLPKAVLTIKSKLLMNLNLRNSDFLCKTRKSGMKCQSCLCVMTVMTMQCNARNRHCNWTCSSSCPESQRKPEMVSNCGISNWNMYSYSGNMTCLNFNFVPQVNL